AGMNVSGLESMKEAAVKIRAMGANAVLVKGGHLEGDAVDVLFDGTGFHHYRASRIETRHTHGTGCTYSACITAELAKGLSLYDAVSKAKNYITRAIASAPGLGLGAGPVNHHVLT
ncbi:MAG TPA: bifunctional hydroxymethylpyrimidine kinase/phosphomethylpyrimidine kinase, partial [Acidobacteriota bacterium]|nr:bifunctional hydroxymethylpyrimidine kinase/phosphomethylpyrimidine kinase [Acidobacteriota bacterium]